jgi:transketolase
VVVIGYGPVLLSEAISAAALLGERDISVRVVNLPWLNRIDAAWLSTAMSGMEAAFLLDDHFVTGGQGDTICAAAASSGLAMPKGMHRFGVVGMPACGSPAEVLRHHRLDAVSIAERIVEIVRAAPTRTCENLTGL